MLRHNVHLISLITLTCVSVTCTPHISVQEPASSSLGDSARDQSIDGTPANKIWQFTTPGRTHTYQSTSYTIISDALRADTIIVKTHFVITISHSNNAIVILGQLDSILVTSSQYPNKDTRVHFPISFTGKRINNQLILNAINEEPDCIFPLGLALGEIRPTILIYPLSVSRATTWTDSISTTACSGQQILTTLNSVSSYHILGEETPTKPQTLLLQATESIKLTGKGTQEQHQLSVEGTGNGISKISIDIKTGAIVTIEANQTVNTSIIASAQVHHFIQVTTQQIRLID